MTKWKIYNEDAVEWAKKYKKGKFHALLCDAPYHLTSIVKRFGKAKVDDDTLTSEKVRNRSDGYSRLISTGFMGTTWDGGDLAFRPETWEAFGEVLHPGAFGMAFSASRNWHRMAVAIEDAGFVLHPTIFLWAYSQGFPKATNISKQLNGDGKIWEGHRYGLQALKPAVEPIIVFQKPYEGKPLQNIVSIGAGTLNIDGARIPVDSPVTINRFTNGAKPWGDAKGEEFDTVLTSHGRWPANLILTEESAERMNGTGKFFYQVSVRLDESDPVYYCGKASPKEKEAGLDKMPKRIAGSMTGEKTRPDRPTNHPIRANVHPTIKPIDLCKYLATLLLPPDDYAPRRIFIPFSGSGSEMIGAGLAGWEHVVGVEFDKENGYVDIAEKRLEHWLK